MSAQRYICYTPEIRANAVAAVTKIQAGPGTKPLVVEIKPLTRTIEQNAKFHAICSDVARQAEYMGRKLDAGQWKLLFISGHAVAAKQQADMVPGLEGEFLNLRESTAQMPVARMASLIEYIQAWCAQNGIWLGDDRGRE
jgi:hypothetical protein